MAIAGRILTQIMDYNDNMGMGHISYQMAMLFFVICYVFFPM